MPVPPWLFMKPLQPPTLLDELPRPSLRRERSFYACLIFIVLPLYAVVPFSWTYVICSLALFRFKFLLTDTWSWSWSWSHRGVLLFCLAEVVFSVYHWLIYRSVVGTKAPPPVDLAYLRQCLTRVLQAGMALPSDNEKTAFNSLGIFEPLTFSDPRAVDFRDRLRTWFRGIPWSAIHKHEVFAWLYWATFGEPFSSIDDIPKSHRAALEDALNLLQCRTGCTLPEGSNPAGRPYRLRIDPVNVWSRPFFLYLLIAIVNHYLRNHFVRKHGAQIGRFNNIDYIVRRPSGWTPSSGTTPIVFFHGLGMGFLQYSRLIHKLLSTFPDRPILVIRQPHISQEVFHPLHLQPPRRSDTSEAIYQLFEKLDWVECGVTILSHSNGSVAHSWIIKDYPRLVTRSCFVDPIVFCMWEGDVAYNFIYRPPTDAMTLVMRYFVGTELGTANTLQRHFDWADNTLWFEEIPHGRDPSRVKFFLGGRDAIVRSEGVRQYLLAHGASDGEGVIWNPDGIHGEAILHSGPDADHIFNWLAQERFSGTNS